MTINAFLFPFYNIIMPHVFSGSGTMDNLDQARPTFALAFEEQSRVVASEARVTVVSHHEDFSLLKSARGLARCLQD